MKSAALNSVMRSRGWLAGLTSMGLFVASMESASAEVMLTESFGRDVPNFSPISSAPGWHVLALQAGMVKDFTTSTPGDNYPNLSHTTTASGVSGPGYLVLGTGNVVSNVLVWTDCRLNLRDCNSNSISFYTKNDLASSMERLVVRVSNQWFATTTTFHDDGGNVDWKLNSYRFSNVASNWQTLQTNTLTLGAPLNSPLPIGDISAIGILGQSAGAGKIRMDEFQVLCGFEAMDPIYRVGSWIWSEQTADRQTCRFWKAFEVPRHVSVSKARLRITADNSYNIYLDGDKIGQGSEWRRLTEYDLTLLLEAGSHVLAVEAFNEVGSAGIVAGVTVDLDDGRIIEIPSDASWRIVPADHKDWPQRTSPLPQWPSARIVARLHDFPGFPDRPRVLFPSALQPPVIRFWQRGWFQLTMLTISVIVGIFYLRLLARLTLQSKAQEVLQRERARIARDIHDDLGAGLTQLVLLGETEQREALAEPETRAKFERISEAGRRLLRSIDEVVWLVNSQRDSLQDFEAYICRYAENFLRASSVRCRLDVDSEIPQLNFSLAARRSLFLVIKEALNNAVRHAGATEVALTIQVANEELRVSVKDNGKGFDPAHEKRERNGLKNMVQRMKEIGGECQVISQPGKGCSVELVVRLTDRSQGWWYRLTRLSGSNRALS